MKLIEHPTDGRVYYRLYRGDDGLPCVVTLQHSDESGYDENRWLSPDRHGDENEAMAALGVFNASVLAMWTTDAERGAARQAAAIIAACADLRGLHDFAATTRQFFGADRAEPRTQR
jgi:hypothetical protein